MNSSRRVFLMAVAASGSALCPSAFAQVMVDEKEGQAAALGYKVDATKVDVKKFPKYAAGQKCSNCSLYQAKGDAASGGCPLFGTKQVAAGAWCSAWAQKS